MSFTLTNIAELREQPLPAELKSAHDLIANLLDYTSQLETKLRLLQYRKYGRSSERFVNPNQPSLFDEAESLSEEAKSLDQDDDNDDETKVGAHTRKKKRRRPIELPDDLERERHVHELSEEERKCSCCGDLMAEIGEDISEKLDVKPAELKVRQDVYKKYACQNKSCDEAPKQTPRVPAALPKIKATPETVAFIAVQKYLYSVPLYRQEQFFTAFKVILSRYVMSLWMIKLADALRPIYLTLEELLLSGDYLHMDETSLQVLKEPGRSAKSNSYMWVRTNGGSRSPPIVLYHYAPHRSAEVASELLSGFSGYLQTDDYSAYPCAIASSASITHLLCWDHARRYFWDAYQAIDKKKRTGSVSEQMLKLIKKLYKIESRAKGLSDDDRLKSRKEHSLEVLEKIKTLCEVQLPSLSPKSHTAKAINYTLDNWDKLVIFTTNGKLNISNSPAEQKVRPFAVGRKNWLFSHTPAGAESSAIIYSIIQTAVANGLNPNTYIKETLYKLPHVKTADDLLDFLPIKRNLVH